MEENQALSVPEDGAELDNASTQTEQANVETQSGFTSPANEPLSLDVVQRLMDERAEQMRAENAERERALRAEFDQREKNIQSKADKAYSRTLAEKQVLTKHAAKFGIDPTSAEFKAITREIQDENFEAVDKELAAPLAPAPTYAPQVPVTQRATLESFVRGKGLDPAAFDVSRWVGVPDVQGSAHAAEFFGAVNAAVKNQSQAAASAQRANVGKQVAQTRNAFGSTAAPGTTGAPLSADSLMERYNKLVTDKTHVPHEERIKRQKEIDDLELELTRLNRF